MFQSVMLTQKVLEIAQNRKNLASNRAKMYKNEEFQEKIIPETLPSLPSARSGSLPSDRYLSQESRINSRKFLITKFKKRVNETHLHKEYQMQLQ